MTNGTDYAEGVANRTRLTAMRVAELQELAASLGIAGASKRRKGELVELISAHTDGAGTAELDDAVDATNELGDLSPWDMILAVPPAQHMRRTLEAFAPHARDGVPIVLCSKGVEQKSLKLMTDVLHETVPNAAPVVLSGPSFAGEVARGLPTAVTPACIVPLGWPRGRYGPTTRRPVGDVVHLERFGNQPWKDSG